MTQPLDFLIALSVAVGSAGLVVATLRRPLFRVVTDLCGTTERGQFWTAYFCVLIVLAPVLATSFFLGFSDAATNPDLFLQRCVFWSSLALTLALVIFGRSVLPPRSQRFPSAPPSGSQGLPKPNGPISSDEG